MQGTSGARLEIGDQLAPGLGGAEERESPLGYEAVPVRPAATISGEAADRVADRAMARDARLRGQPVAVLDDAP